MNHRPKNRKVAIKSSARTRMMTSWMCRQAKWSPSPKRFHTRRESRERIRTRLLAFLVISRSESWSRASTSWVRLKTACSLWFRGLKVSNLPGHAHLSKRLNLASRCDSKAKVKWIIHLNQEQPQSVNLHRHLKIRSRVRRKWNVCRSASNCELSSWTSQMAFQFSLLRYR